jgi:hypothetical protein
LELARQASDCWQGRLNTHVVVKVTKIELATVFVCVTKLVVWTVVWSVEVMTLVTVLAGIVVYDVWTTVEAG